VDGDFMGPNLYYGQGAGKKPTASAVVSDIMDISRRIMQPESKYLAPLGRDFSQKKELVIQKMDDLKMIYYIRFYAIDQPGVLAVIAGILAKYEISIASMIQKGREVKGAVPIVMLTHEAKEKNMQKALLEINQSKEVSPGKTVLIRVETGKL
jgi:homoserine dehydrogenase